MVGRRRVGWGGRGGWLVEHPHFYLFFIFLLFFFPSRVKERAACENETGARFLSFFFLPLVVVGPLMHLSALGGDSRRIGGGGCGGD